MQVREYRDSSAPGRIAGVRLCEEALPGSLFERLARAVRATGRERLKQNYTTTFWHPRGAEPRNVVEACIEELLRLADPGVECVGTEWWLGRLKAGRRLRYHFDRDMTLRKQTGEYVHPLLSSVLYLNAFPDCPTVVLDQSLAEDGETRIPPKPRRRVAIEAVPNRYLVFPGSLRHGVRPRRGDGTGDQREFRLSLLVNYWHRRPLPPVCRDYDGSIYPQVAEA